MKIRRTIRFFSSFSALGMEHLHVHRFLAPLQTLRKFEFIFLSVGTESFFDAYQWENLLLNHLTQLVTFNFQIEDFPNTINQTIIDQYRRPFWLDRHWYVACDKHRSTLFTVPRFAPCSNSDALFPISSDYTTLPVEQHVIFVDRISKLQFDRDTSLPPYRYNHVQELDLWIPYRYENVLDLSQVQTLNVATNQWPFFEMMTLIKEQMPLINNLSLKLTYRDLRYQRLPDISLPQIRTLKLPVFGQSKKNNLFHWSRYFPCVERLTASFSSRRQLRF